jgi:hypothetical protein
MGSLRGSDQVDGSADAIKFVLELFRHTHEAHEPQLHKALLTSMADPQFEVRVADLAGHLDLDTVMAADAGIVRDAPGVASALSTAVRGNIGSLALQVCMTTLWQCSLGVLRRLSAERVLLL